MADTSGSAFLNEAFLNLAHRKIMDIEFEFPLETPVVKAPGTMLSLVHDFEHWVKRNMDLDGSKTTRNGFKFRLRSLSNNFFEDYEFTISDKEWYDIFTPLTVRVLEVLRDQYNQAKDCQKPLKIDVLIVSGEYSLNAELRRAITNYVSTWTDLPRIEFTNELTSAAVAIGSVYRALDKSNGPGRFLRAVFGLVRHLPAPIDPEDDPDEFDFPTNNPEFSRFSPANSIRISKGRDGHWYSFGTVEWILPKGTALAPGQIFGPYGSKHVFETFDEPWVFSESLFTTAADNMEHGWPWDHDKNRSAERYGDVAVDMNAVKKYAAQLQVLNHYEVDLDLCFTVGAEFHHQLTFEARCGSGDLPAGMIQAKVNVMLQPFFQTSTK